MDKATIIYGEAKEVRLGTFASTTPIKAAIQKAYGKVPANLTAASMLVHKLQKQHAGSPAVLERAYIKVGLVKNQLVFRVKHTHPPVFQKDAVLVDDIVATQQAFSKTTKDVKLSRAWLRTAMTGSKWLRRPWALDLMTQFDEMARLKALVKKTVEMDELRRHVSQSIIAAKRISDTSTDGFEDIWAWERKHKMRLKESREMLQLIAYRANERGSFLKTKEEILKLVDPRIPRITEADEEREFRDGW